ncbi:MAG: transposase [Parcubacteria group bacterium]|nr:transposase [Parcubacteria group bacterium]
MRKVPFINGQFYHIYNRGVDKRDIFLDSYDMQRFWQSMLEFNTSEPIGSIYENSFKKQKLPALGNPTSKLVNIICYCLNSNHYHFILEQIADNGISKFMKRLGGYSKYFNEKYNRGGTLLQGRFKAIHVDSNEYLLHVSAYINLNDKVHQLGNPTSKLVRSSWAEYGGNSMAPAFCKKDMILGQFNNADEYNIFAKETTDGIVERRKEDKKLEALLLE